MLSFYWNVSPQLIYFPHVPWGSFWVSPHFCICEGALAKTLAFRCHMVSRFRRLFPIDCLFCAISLSLSVLSHKYTLHLLLSALGASFPETIKIFSSFVHFLAFLTSCYFSTWHTYCPCSGDHILPLLRGWRIAPWPVFNGAFILWSWCEGAGHVVSFVMNLLVPGAK